MGAASSKHTEAEEKLISPLDTKYEFCADDIEENNEDAKDFCQKPKYQKFKQVESLSSKSEDIQHASFGRLMELVRPEWLTLFFATCALVVSTTAQLAQPLFFGKIIEICSSDESNRMNELNKYAFLLLLILIVGGISTTIRGWLYTLIGERLVRKLRADLFYKIVNQDITFFDVNKTGELMNRLSSDTAVIQSCLSVNISMGLRSLAEVFVSVVLLFITSWELTLVMIAVVPALLIIIIIYGRFTKRLTQEYQDALAKAADTGTESISNVRIMKSFGAEEWESQQYSNSITTSYHKGASKAWAYGIFVGGLGFLMGIAILVVVYFGAVLVIHDHLNVGNLTSFILYTIYIAIGLGVLSSLYTEFMNAVGASER